MRKLSYRVLFLSLVVLLLLSLSSLHAQKLDVNRFQLDNGLKVIILEDHSAPIISVQIWYRVGSRNERSGETGLSHMLEHMAFKGSSKLKSEEFSQIVQRNGGFDNASTWCEDVSQRLAYRNTQSNARKPTQICSHYPYQPVAPTWMLLCFANEIFDHFLSISQ